MPSGYELVDVDEGSSLVLPEAMAHEHREETERRRVIADAAFQADLAQRRHERAKVDAEERTAVDRDNAQKKAVIKNYADFGHAPMPGWYRVMPKWNEFLESTSNPAAGLRSAEREVNERRAKVRDRLVQKGPDRRLAKPRDWRQALENLENSLPHFREPIRLVRNPLALAEATGRPVRITPLLLLGPLGVGKSFFARRLADMMKAQCAFIGFDHVSSNSALLGSDSFWGNSATGLLFNLICLADEGCANPVILLDELDKSRALREIDPLAQLHGALEPETSRHAVDCSVEIEFDASQVTYVATANTARGIGVPILSRMEAFWIDVPNASDSVEIARSIVEQTLDRLELRDTLSFDRKGLYVLAHMSPRLMLRTAENSIAAAIAAGRQEILEADVWAEARYGDDGPRLH